MASMHDAAGNVHRSGAYLGTERLPKEGVVLDALLWKGCVCACMQNNSPARAALSLRQLTANSPFSPYVVALIGILGVPSGCNLPR